MSTPQNTTAYIPTPISDHPKEDGEYFVINSKNRVERFQFGVSVGCWVCESGDIAEDKEFPSDCRWLRPVDLSRMLEAGESKAEQVLRYIITELGTVNFSSHNQMREAIEGGLGLAEGYFQQRDSEGT